MRTTRRHKDLNDIQRHISAIRAFHTGLIAETQRHLRVLQEMARHIDLLRSRYTPPPAKLAALRAACRQLRALEALKQPWRETYRDLRHRLRRARVMFAEIVHATRSKVPRNAAGRKVTVDE
jgi:hypothetical protein